MLCVTLVGVCVCVCRAIVSRVAASELDYMIDQLISKKVSNRPLHTQHTLHTLTQDPRFMEFLGNLCVCAGRPIPATQSKSTPHSTPTRPLHPTHYTEAILDNLVDAHGRDVFYRLEVGVSSQRPDATPTSIYLQVPGQKEWRELTSVAGKVGVKVCTPLLTFDPIGGRANR